MAANYFAEFKGHRVFIVDGAITTYERFENGVISLAHIFRDGSVRRFQRVIGMQADVVPLEDEVPDMSAGEILEGIVGCLSNEWSEESRPRDDDDAWFDALPTINALEKVS